MSSISRRINSILILHRQQQVDISRVLGKYLEELRSRYESHFQKKIFSIGRITEETGMALETAGQERRTLEVAGYDHFVKEAVPGKPPGVDHG